MKNKRYKIMCIVMLLLFSNLSVVYAEKDNATTATKLLVLCYQAKNLYNQLDKFVLAKDEKCCSLTPLYAAVGGSECFGYILEMPKKIYIVFRGTESYSDMFKDFMLWKTSFSYVQNGGYVHRGFLSVYDGISEKQPISLREQISRKLMELNSDKQLIITGFSLGGALATLCSCDVAENTNFKDPVVYTFASPRVGDQKFVDAFNQRVRQSIRVINYHDYIPCSPFRWMGYRHVKGKVALKVNAGYLGLNHKLTSVYFPGLVANTPEYVEKLINKKGSDLCPPLPAVLPAPSWEQKEDVLQENEQEKQQGEQGGQEEEEEVLSHKEQEQGESDIDSILLSISPF